MRRSTQGCVLPGPEDSESRRSRFRRLSVLLLAAAAGPVSSSSRARTSAGRRRVKGASAGWCGRERSGRHGPARLDAAKACATVAVLGRRADGDGRSVAAACRGGGTPRAASALSEARSGSGGMWGWRDVSSGMPIARPPGMGRRSAPAVGPWRGRRLGTAVDDPVRLATGQRSAAAGEAAGDAVVQLARRAAGVRRRLQLEGTSRWAAGRPAAIAATEAERDGVLPRAALARPRLPAVAEAARQ